ncbi:hypothetical protein KGA66_26945 [Actinocrinis puniceicyclus]|uniref:Uncharacterized protein n=1 Tax=Actinocrinis puniceicyclus TaxID=977794 RepID=A0A8J7WQM3_9ACTN|nr:hypothetical protein [Actinocrinis puniceicyclus]MBS2966703.1 hypothetical protein [Actinocrinis puniceicyclus]
MTTRETTETLRGWFTGRLPQDLFDAPPEVTVDREEITVIGRIPEPETAEGASAAEKAAAVTGRIKEFRERTRSARVRVAREAEHEFGRKVSWWVRCGETTQPFTTLSVPVMTRLKQQDRQLLDTLVDAGVARSRSDALAWCVRQVGQRAETWLADLREAMRTVEQVRDAGPDLG